MRRYRTALIALICVLILVIVYRYISSQSATSTEQVATAPPTEVPSATATASSTTPSPLATKTTATATPKPKPIAPPFVPFISQAPSKNWDADHEDACEEASLYMAYLSVTKQSAPSIDLQEKEIMRLISLGKSIEQNPSITLQELKQLSNKAYPEAKMQETIFTYSNAKDLTAHLDKGEIIIIGASGKALGNPHFKNGGPNYHMLVIKSYDSTGYSTNDPGTQFGENYHYSFSTIAEAMHNWNSTDINLGAKEFMVLAN